MRKNLLYIFSLSSDSGAEWTGSPNRQNPVKSEMAPIDIIEEGEGVLDLEEGMYLLWSY